MAVGLLTLAVGCAAEPAEDTPEAEADAELKTRAHRRVSEGACNAQHLPAAFCKRVGSEAFDVDAREWTDLAAHGQREAGQSQCAAATSVAKRLATLGKEIHAALRTRDPGQANRIASNLGRALHTVEDNCAHHGMSNPQHAWYDHEAECHQNNHESGPDVFGDPDKKPEALACAENEANKTMAAFAAAARAAQYPLEALGGVGHLEAFNPSAHQACEFMRESTSWDGRDTTWNNASTVPAFRRVLADAMSSGAGASEVCSGLRNPHPFPGRSIAPNACAVVCPF